jgi:hypothetical protein
MYNLMGRHGPFVSRFRRWGQWNDRLEPTTAFNS